MITEGIDVVSVVKISIIFHTIYSRDNKHEINLEKLLTLKNKADRVVQVVRKKKLMAIELKTKTKENK